jgi:alcohol dehydrogenase YqhD (iron-dependent ADH family)
MENFTIYNPVKVHFGKGVLDQLGGVVAGIGSKVLLVYGKGSIVKNGLYDKVKEQLSAAGCTVWEYHGIKSNPLVEDVDAAAAVGREQGAQVILAVGGGSVIDSAKVIAAAIPYGGPAWDLLDRKAKPTSALPVITVLTLAATGSEMNPFAVLQNEALGIKTSFSSPFSFPVHSFLDPAYTTSVNAQYTGYGVADLMAHALEAWFGKGDSPLADRVVLGILEEAMEAGPLLMKSLKNYDLRARIMYAATLALNGTTMHGRAHGEWGVHGIGHTLSLMFDVPHGASLTIVYPAWLKLMKERIPERISELLFKLFYTDDIDDGIYKLEYFFKILKCPLTLAEIGIGEDQHPEILAQWKKNRVSGMHYPLNEADFSELLRLMA